MCLVFLFIKIIFRRYNINMNTIYPNLNILRDNIIEVSDNKFELKASPELINDTKEMYGIDLSNSNLLSIILKFGAVKIELKQ